MINSLKALGVTLSSFRRQKVTAEYPKEHLPVDERYMGFPALLWDSGRDEPFCTGCMVCVRYCPTQCMTAEMHDNPKFASGDSHRRKIIEKFEINLNRCILCGICVDACPYDALRDGGEFELAHTSRAEPMIDLMALASIDRETEVSYIHRERDWLQRAVEEGRFVDRARLLPVLPASVAAASTNGNGSGSGGALLGTGRGHGHDSGGAGSAHAHTK